MEAVTVVVVWSGSIARAATTTPGATRWAGVALTALVVVAATLGALARGRRSTPSPIDGKGLGIGAVVAAAALGSLVAAALAPELDVPFDLVDSAAAAAVLVAALAIEGLVFQRRFQQRVASGRIRRSAALIGGPSDAGLFTRRYRALGYHLDLLVDPSPADDSEPVSAQRLRTLDDAEAALEAIGGRTVFLAADRPYVPAAEYLVDRLLDQGVEVRTWAPVLDRADRLTAVNAPRGLRMTARRADPALRLVKRVVDTLTAAALLVLVAPVLAWAAWRIHREDGGSWVFRQRRVGRGGRTFELLKLRTMVEGASEMQIDLTFDNERIGGPLFKLASDPRRTRIGKRLERLSIDELPQLWNVIRGEMSLVGPRPALPHEVATFDRELLRRHSVTPGITGLWQLNARDNPSFEEYRRLDLYYLRHWTLRMDLSIFVRTLFAVVRRVLRTAAPSTPAAPQRHRARGAR